MAVQLVGPAGPRQRKAQETLLRSARAICPVGFLLFALVVPQAGSAAEFSAELIERGPQGVTSRGHLYVSGSRSRSETLRDGARVVVITDRAQGRQWLLNPAEHAFFEFALPALQHDSGDPCSGVGGAVCTKDGSGDFNGRPVIRWRMSVETADGAREGLYLFDEERGIPLYQQLPDGTNVERRRIGFGRIAGRYVEKWETVSEQPGQVPSRSLQWIDPELDVPVREEAPGGFVRQLRNIEIAPQPATLFEIPVDYRLVQPSAPGATPDPRGR